ncbi:lanthionine synthetase LanC family protein [Corynebacterium sp.]|uniref:lanthionine synthetase LanC family protein n=1 Tax=Corynebacterium sp. TaxID=1720 RepID=UPI0026DD14A9|nr:lanthionine synthetase LanC family protein [Corynebacterium sp.]MDO5077199.1 lanthionine synthetase LanC family protein [Corynebacterium sp.]
MQTLKVHTYRTWEQCNAVLFRELARECRAQDSLHINQGSLGKAYAAAAMAALDDSYDWDHVVLTHLNGIFASLGGNSYHHAGVLGGLTGLALLLQSAKSSPEEFAGALHKLESRMLRHVQEGLERLRRDVGMPRFDYDFAIGLTGQLYYFTLFPPAEPNNQNLVREATEFLAQVATSDFEDFFWSPSISVPPEVIQQEPKAAFGILDFGQAHGIAGVLGLMLLKLQTDDREIVEPAIAPLLAALVRGYDASIVPCLPYYLCGHPSSAAWWGPGAETPHPGPAARNGWCYGLPMVEAFWWAYGLDIPDRIKMSFDAPTYLDPASGGFDEPGLCHGLAGRMSLNYLVGKPIPGAWWERAEQFMAELAEKEGAYAADSDHKWGFWDGVSGLHVVMHAIASGQPLPKQLQILGVPCGNIAL